MGIDDRIVVFDASSATAELATKALGCESKGVAKSLAFLVENQPILIVASGNAKYEYYIDKKTKMINGIRLKHI